jgi:hypothetical protein
MHSKWLAPSSLFLPPAIKYLSLSLPFLLLLSLSLSLYSLSSLSLTLSLSFSCWQVLDVNSAYFPETIFKFYLINAPLVFRAVWRAPRPPLFPRNLS